LIDGAPLGFDALIGAKLLEASMDGVSDWDQFEKILEDQEVSFDEGVKQKMENFEVPYNGSQWPKLSEHLEKIEKRRRRILITKFIEAAVFILFVLTIMQLYPIHDLVKKPVYRTHGVAENLNSGRQNDLSTGVASIFKDATIDAKSNEDRKDFNASQSDNDDLTTDNSTDNDNSILSDGLSFTNTDGLLSYEGLARFNTIEKIPSILKRRTKGLAILDQYLSKNEEAKVISASKIDINQPLAIDYNREKLYLNADKDGSEYDVPVMLASLEIPSLEIEGRDFLLPVKELASKFKRAQTWVSVYGSPQINMINTPFDKSYSASRYINTEEGVIEAYSHLAEGYSIGGAISKETAAVEIEGGIEYTSLNYYPKQITERVSNATVGYKDILLKEIIFDIIEIPLNIKYNIFKKKGWKIYGSNGLSLGVVASASFDIESKESKPLIAASATPNRNRNTGTFVDRKNFDEGYIASGNFLENSYTTMSMGVGVSKEISDHMSFYVQPTYHHNLSQSGIGPNNDVHHRLAVQIGTKVRI